MGHEFPAKPENHEKQWILVIFWLFDENPIQSPWKSPKLTVFDRTGPIGPIHRTGLTEQFPTPYQTPWKGPKLSEKCQKCVQNVTFSEYQVCRWHFSGFRRFLVVFSWISVKLRLFDSFLGKTWHLANSKNHQKQPKFVKNHQNSRNSSKNHQNSQKRQNRENWLPNTVSFGKMVSFEQWVFGYFKKWWFWPVWYSGPVIVSKWSLVNPPRPARHPDVQHVATVVVLPSMVGYPGYGWCRHRGVTRGMGPGVLYPWFCRVLRHFG